MHFTHKKYIIIQYYISVRVNCCWHITYYTGIVCNIGINGVLRKLKHVFPNTYQRIKSIHSPAKVGTGCYKFNYQPGS